MIENFKIAEYVSKLLLGVNGQLNEFILTVERDCSPDELTAYRRCVGKLVNLIFEDILEPIYLRYPTLKPPELEM